MSKMRSLVVLFFCACSANVFSELQLISLDSDLYEQFMKKRPEIFFSQSVGKHVLVSLDEEILPYIGQLAHEKFRRCGGYVLEDSMEEAYSLLASFQNFDNFESKKLQDKEEVRKFMKEVSPEFMKETIEKMSSFQNRYYESTDGVQSQTWVLQKWKSLAKNRSDVSVSFFEHKNFKQPSVVLTIKGEKRPEEFVILGGHGDSISGWFPDENVRAPGADDNASGIATLTEVLRIFLESGKKPVQTVQFISYAAEEVGLRGSKEIAKNYSRAGKDVKAVLQFDMTNFSGSPYDFVFISDYTTDSLSAYLSSLVEMYLPDYKWAYDKCGYACSDHASWYREGFSVAFPFESTFDHHNEKIHTKEDTLDVSQNSALHAAKFSRLALAFLGEFTL